MKIKVERQSLNKVKCDLLVINVFTEVNMEAFITKDNSRQAQKPQETVPPPQPPGSLRPLLGQVPPKGYRHHYGPHSQERPGKVFEAGDLAVTDDVPFHYKLNFGPCVKYDVTLNNGIIWCPNLLHRL